MNNNNNNEQQIINYIIYSDRQLVDFIEIGILCLLIIFGIILNFLAFIKLIRYSRSSSKNNSKLLFPLYMNSFTLFKFNLAITDFAILLVHALGKLIWLLSYRWLFGDFGCRLYQFLSAFTYYSNSNVVVAIGLDRLKIVYSSHLQQNNNSSIRRVKLFILIAWSLAFICALPQIFFWTNFELEDGWSQCTTIWQISEHIRSNNLSNNNNTTITYHWSLNKQTQFYYELLHQFGVFVIPFISLFSSYFLIILKVLRYTLKHNQLLANCNSYSSLIAPENWSGIIGNERQQLKYSFKNNNKIVGGIRRCSSGTTIWRLPQDLNCFIPFGRKFSEDCHSPFPLAAVPEEGIIGDEKEYNKLNITPAPPPSPKIPISLNLFLFGTTLSGSSPNLRFQTKRSFSILSKLSRTASERNSRRKNNCDNFSISNNSLQRKAKRCSLNVPSSNENNLTKQKIINLTRINGGRYSQPINELFNEKFQRNSKSSMCSSINRSRTPLWRKQLRSKVFLRSLLIVAAHCVFWLPYNLLNLLRFSNESLYSILVEKGALLVEDLIVMNAMLNPLLYGEGK